MRRRARRSCGAREPSFDDFYVLKAPLAFFPFLSLCRRCFFFLSAVEKGGGDARKEGGAGLGGSLGCTSAGSPGARCVRPRRASLRSHGRWLLACSLGSPSRKGGIGNRSQQRRTDRRRRRRGGKCGRGGNRSWKAGSLAAAACEPSHARRFVSAHICSAAAAGPLFFCDSRRRRARK